MKSSLHPSGQSLVLPFIGSVLVHGGLVAAFTVASIVIAFLGPRKPIIDPDDAMEVAMVTLPKSKSAIPDKATRAPEVVGTPTPEPVPVPAPEVKHNSDMVVQKPEAPPKPGVDTKKLEDALDMLESTETKSAQMDALLDEMARPQTDPDGSDEGVDGPTVGVPGDPEFARYIAKVQRIFVAEFHPLQSVRAANPGLECVIHVSVDDSGRILRYDVKRPSGVEAFDAAARRAVESITNIPLPPEKYRDRMGTGYDIEFE